MEVAIPTKMGRHSGYPTCYKVDIANRDLKVAIEVDGHTHNCTAIRQADTKKTAFLESLGWSMLRFTNAEVLGDLTKCVQTVLSTISRQQEVTRTQQKVS
jgi:very-short-patch-repair endonuclease